MNTDIIRISFSLPLKSNRQLKAKAAIDRISKQQLITNILFQYAETLTDVDPDKVKVNMARTMVQGQDDNGRFYYSYKEKTRAAGRIVEIYLTLIREDQEIGRILVRDRWIHGGVNFSYMGPIKWVRYLEKNLDSILDKALKHFKKSDPTYELVAVEGWRIMDKKITSTHNMFYADTSPDADPRL